MSGSRAAAESVDVVVVGSGAGGLTAALGCAIAGKKVVVCEQHYLPGGWCHSFPLGGYQYSPGVHYVGALAEGGKMREIYEGLGLAKHLTWLELNPEGYDHVRIGESFRFDIPRGFDRYKERLKQVFPHEARGIDGYLDTIRALDAEIRAGFGRNRRRDLLTLPFRSPNLVRWGLRPLSHLLDRYVRDPKLRAVLTIQAGDHGLPPSRVPAALHASVVAHYFDGGWYPKGGAAAIPRAYLRELDRYGAEVRLETDVERILVERGRAIGVRLKDGTEIRAEVVISNADPELTFRELVGAEHLSRRLSRRLDRTRYSLSNLSLFAAVDLDLESRGYDSGNYWYSRSPDVEATYARAEAATTLADAEYDALFVTVTTLKDRSKKKHGIHTVEAFNLVTPRAFQRWAGTFGGRPADYADLKKQVMDAMIQTTERVVPGFRDALVFAEIGTPSTNRHYVRSIDGNMYGTEKSALQVGPFAFPVRTEIAGLYLCGAATLGHGVAGATISGLVAASKAAGCRVDELLCRKDASLRMLPCDDLAVWPEKDRRRIARNNAPTVGLADRDVHELDAVSA